MTQLEFINYITPIIQKNAYKYGYHVCSPIIAQAILESGYGTPYQSELCSPSVNNFFGMKCGSNWTGRRYTMVTSEYVNGSYVQVTCDFRAYDTIEDGIIGYFDFIQKDRYANLKGALTPYAYLDMIYKDGYATSPTYVENVERRILMFDLMRFDIPFKIISCEYGNGTDRVSALEREGYVYRFYQDMVNNILL